MIEMLAHSAVWGFGSSFGHDAYRRVKNTGAHDLILACIIALMFMAVWGFRGLARNIGNRAQSHRVWRILGSVVAIILGFVGTVIIFAIFADSRPIRGDLVALTYIIFAVIGIGWGIIKKRKDNREFDLAASNVAFLEQRGLRDSPFDTDLIEDADGNRLRIKETRDDAIVFSVVGKRDMRALISLNDEGRMLDYSGVVQL